MTNWLKKHFTLTPKKSAYTVDGWNNWERHAKARWPVRWFVLNTIPDFVVDNVFSPVQARAHNAKWWILHRTLHRYHVINCRTLKPGYYDPCDRMFHAAFEMLNQYYEYGFDQAFREPTEADYERTHDEDGSHNEYNISAAWYKDRVPVNREIQFLWGWWNFIRPSRIDPYEEDLPAPEGAEDDCLWVLSNKFKKTPEYEAWTKWSEECTNIEQKWRDEDEEMLIRLVKLRQYLWN